MASISVGTTARGIFVHRVNRFLAYALTQPCFLPNPGRLADLLYPRVEVFVVPSPAPGRKTAFDLVGVRSGKIKVSIDSRMPNKLVLEALRRGELEPFSGYREIRAEYAFGSSRIDFYLPGRVPCILEVKSCTLVRSRVALFPDAPTERGVRHLAELSMALEQGLRSSIIFIIQREDADAFKPNGETDPIFEISLREAYSRGVEVYAYRSIFDGSTLTLDGRVPVEL